VLKKTFPSIKEEEWHIHNKEKAALTRKLVSDDLAKQKSKGCCLEKLKDKVRKSAEWVSNDLEKTREKARIDRAKSRAADVAWIDDLQKHRRAVEVRHWQSSRAYYDKINKETRRK
jgi:hypothetical protein